MIMSTRIKLSIAIWLVLALNGPIIAAYSEESKDEIYKQGLGLRSSDLHLVNQGRFEELADQLASKLSGQTTVSRETAWLAFTYLYMQKCDQLKELVNSFDSSASQNINFILMQSFSLLCEKKLDLAEKQLQTIPAAAMNDAFVNYAFATLAGKQGKPQVSITYTKRAIELAPDFAWGY